MTIIRLISGLFVVGLVAGCGGGGGDGGGGGGEPPAPPVTNNLAASALQVTSTDPRIGYPLKVSLSISAEQATDNVSVSFFAVEKIPNPVLVQRQIPLGSETIARIQAGSHAYAMEFNIPSSVEHPGRYFVAAIVDPVGAVPETSVADNTASTEATFSAPVVPNIFIKAAMLDRTVLEVDTSTYQEQVPPGSVGNVHNSDAAATITVGADGLDVNATLDLQAFAKLRLMRSDKGTQHDVPLYLWNPNAGPVGPAGPIGRYTNAFGVDPAAPPCFNPFSCSPVLAEPEWLPLGQFKPQLVQTLGADVSVDDVHRDSVQLAFYLPGKLGSELDIALRHRFVTLSDPNLPPPDLTPQAITALRGFLFGLPGGAVGDEGPAMAVMSFAICTAIRPADTSVVDRDATDNEICSPIAITLPPNPPPIPVPQVPPAFVPHFPRASNALISNHGFRTQGGGSAFGFSLDFNAMTSADYRGLIMETRGSLPVTVFGQTVELVKATARSQLIPDYAGKPAGEHAGFQLELRFAGAMLTNLDVGPVSLPSVSLTFSKEWPDPAKEFDTYVGPVPVTGSASVSGNIGIEYENEFAAVKLVSKVGPFASLEAGVSAGFGNKFASVGVEGTLELVKEKLAVAGGTEITLLDAGFTSGIAEFVIQKGEKIVNSVTGPKGILSLYAKFQVPKLKDCSWGFFTGKCPTIATVKVSKELLSSKPWHQDDTLYDNPSIQLDVVVMHGKPPAYYSP